MPFDVIHSHGALPCGYAAARLGRKLNIPFVVTAHGIDVFSTRQAKGVAGRWCKDASRMVYESAAKVVCVSKRVQREVIEGSPEAQTSVVYNGVDPVRFCPQSCAETNTVLSVGNLIPTKGHEALIRALAGVASTIPEISCEVIGDGPELQRLQESAARLGIAGRVRFGGRKSRTEVAEAMQRCRLFVLPSNYEALGCVYLEAMACGKVAVGCRGQGTEEIIQHGRNGWLIEPNNVDELVSALKALFIDDRLRRSIGEAARDSVLERYTIDRQSQLLSEVYRECVA
jgi:glycosyltransferase involved in cell wall biosynthesis